LMSVAPSIIYAVVGALAVAVAGLWAVVLSDHKECQTNLKAANHSIKLLSEHTIAQQHDISSLVEDRKKRGLPGMVLKSERTEFYRTEIEGQDI
jgi:hypothetical protein